MSTVIKTPRVALSASRFAEERIGEFARVTFREGRSRWTLMVIPRLDGYPSAHWESKACTVVVGRLVCNRIVRAMPLLIQGFASVFAWEWGMGRYLRLIN